MALRLSKGLRNSLLGNAFLMGADLSYVDGGVGDDRITDINNNFIKAGFRVGDAITTTGSTTGTNDITAVVLTGVTAGSLSFATGTLGVSEPFIVGTKLVSNNTGSFQVLFLDGVLEIYSGSQPASADDAEVGTKLLRITVGSGAFTPGSPTNGLEFDPVLDGVLSKASDEIWSGVGLVAGSAGWFRFYSNNYDSMNDGTAVRFDGSVGTSNAQLNLSSVAIAVSATTTIDKFQITMPTA